MNARPLVIAVLLSTLSAAIRADTVADQTAAFNAQAARDAAEAAAIKAASDLAKAKAAMPDVNAAVKKDQYDAATALATSKVQSQTAELAALKTAFGEPPKVGTDGTIAISDSTTGMLLQTKSGSLQATWLLAEKLCGTLKAAEVTDAIVAPADLDTKLQNSRLVLREFNALVEKIQTPENRDAVGLGGVAPQVAPAAILGAVSLLQYGAGALESVAKLFRSDYSVAVADTKRDAWLEIFAASKCPKQIPRVQIEAAMRAVSQDAIFSKVNSLAEFADAASAQKVRLKNSIDQTTARIDELKKKKEPSSVAEGQLGAFVKSMAAVAALDPVAIRVKAVLDLVSAKPEVFLEALTWSTFVEQGLDKMPRVTAVLTTQDGQVTKTNWLFGKSVYGRSGGELIYRVTLPDGRIKVAGYLTATASTGKYDFNATGTEILEDKSQIVK